VAVLPVEDTDAAEVGLSFVSIAQVEPEVEAPLTTMWIATGDDVSVEINADNGIAFSFNTLPA
jgi:hypothetical protein